MSTKNCPETPRQRLIGMMYLVLTAMLALNVSADVLDAFTKVQVGLTSTIANFNKKNTEAYNEIEMAYSLNQKKVEGVRNKAIVIKDETQSLVDFIEKLKKKLVVLVDGKEGDVLNIKGKDNLDAGGQLMIQQGEGKVLRDKLAAYREKLLEYVDPKDSVMRAAILIKLNTDDPKPVEGDFQSWQSSRFESIPLVGVVTLLTMLQADILNAESDVIRYLFSSIDAESFKFNKLEALVIPESRYVLKGESFKARIMLAAIDTTQKPQIIANGRDLAYKGDFGEYTEAATTVGVRKIKGVINYLSPSGVTLPRSFEMEYEVAEAAVVISPTKMNVFYVGVDNPVSLAAPGLSEDAILPEMTNGDIIKTSGGYVVRPKVPGKKCEITVYAKVDGQKRKLQTQEFRVKEVPDPVVKVAGQKSGTIKRNLLLAAGEVDVEMEGFDFDMKFTVQSFKIYTIVDGYAQDAASSGASFSPEQLRMIKGLKHNQVLGIEQIMVKGQDGSVRRLPSASFKID